MSNNTGFISEFLIIILSIVMMVLLLAPMASFGGITAMMITDETPEKATYTAIELVEFNEVDGDVLKEHELSPNAEAVLVDELIQYLTDGVRGDELYLFEGADTEIPSEFKTHDAVQYGEHTFRISVIELPVTVYSGVPVTKLGEIVIPIAFGFSMAVVVLNSMFTVMRRSSVQIQRGTETVWSKYRLPVAKLTIVTTLAMFPIQSLVLLP